MVCSISNQYAFCNHLSSSVSHLYTFLFISSYFIRVCKMYLHNSSKVQPFGKSCKVHWKLCFVPQDKSKISR